MFGKLRLARGRLVGTKSGLANGLLASVAGEPSCPMAGGAHAELKVAGPHAAQRRVVFGARAGGLLEDHAAAGLALAASLRAETRRT